MDIIEKQGDPVKQGSVARSGFLPNCLPPEKAAGSVRPVRETGCRLFLGIWAEPG
jgi:hypothetical protein